MGLKVLLCALGIILAGFRSATAGQADAILWSPGVVGLRGHLAIEPTHDPDPTEPTYKVLLVLENVGQIGNFGKISQTIVIDFSQMNLNLEVKDSKNSVLSQNQTLAGNRISGIYHLVLPPDGGLLSFTIARGGDAPPRSVQGGNLSGKFLQEDDSFAAWIVPPASVGKYFLSGTVTCERPIHATLEESRRETPHAWHGTLVLPPVEVPQN